MLSIVLPNLGEDLCSDVVEVKTELVDLIMSFIREYLHL